MSSERLYRPTGFEEMIDELVVRARKLVVTGERRLLGITGPPGSGKTTVCDALAAALGSASTVVGMDGFHLGNDELIRLGRRDRKGAPDTFDVDGYTTMLGRMRNQDAPTIYAPRFDRHLEEAVGSSVPVARETPLVITEGNYLLLSDGGWRNVRPALDEVWFLDVAEATRVKRLVDRQRGHGISFDDARRWTEQVDVPNSRYTLAGRGEADLIVMVPAREAIRDELGRDYESGNTSPAVYFRAHE